MAVPLARQKALFQRSRSFRQLFLATLGSGIGTWLAAIALTVDVYDRTHSGEWVSGLLIADFLPGIFVGLLLGSLVDRLSRRRLMLGADLMRLAVFCALPFIGSVGAIVGAAAVIGLANGFFVPSVHAGLPNLVAEDELVPANSLFQTADNLSWAVGPLLGGALVALQGPHLAYWLNAVTFLASALLISRIPAGLLQSDQALSRGHWRDLADGFRAVVRSRPLLTVLVAWTIAMFGSAAINVGEVVIAKLTFNAGSFGFGFMAAASGVGLIAGGLLGGSSLERLGVGRVYGPYLLLMALGVGGAALSPNVWVASLCVLAAGIGNGAAVITNVTIVQRSAPDRIRGRALTLIMSINSAVRGLAMAGAGVFVDHYGARWLWGVAALALVVSALVGAGLMPRGEPTPATESAL